MRVFVHRGKVLQKNDKEETEKDQVECDVEQRKEYYGCYFFSPVVPIHNFIPHFSNKYYKDSHKSVVQTVEVWPWSNS